jgi:pilus assembly protein FimV
MVLGMVLGFGFNKTKVLAAAERYVQQGKLQNAIVEYEKVCKEDPKDLTVLNTIGDLNARIGQVDKAVEYFKRVGDAYAANGFTVKAIAMYKKLTKISPGSLECIQKLGDLYTQQGLYNDARAQLVQVAEHHMRQGKLENAAGVFQKMLELDPENAAMQTRLAELYVKIGKKEEARNIYFRAAESLHGRGSMKPAEEALNKVLALDPQNSRALQLLGQTSLENGNPERAIELLEKVPDLDSRSDCLQSLLKALLKAGRTADAEPIARKLFSVHNDLTGIVDCAEALLHAGMTQPAITLFEDYADRLLGAEPDRLIEAMNLALARAKDNAGQLETLRKLYSRAGDQTHSAEVAELLAHASVQAGDLVKARDLYQQLSEMEPDNPLHLQNYKQILAKLGEDSMVQQMAPEVGAQPFVVDEIEPVETVVEQNYPEELTAAIQVALTESELFDSYNVPTKAIPPLEAALPRAPYNLRLNQRLASLYARTGRYADAARACAVVKDVYASAGHSKEAGQFGEMAAKYAQRAGVAVPQTHKISADEISPATPAPAPPSVEVEFPETLTFETAAPAAEVPVAAPVMEVLAPEPVEIVEPAAPGTAHEIDLSDEWEKMLTEEVAHTTPVEPEAAAPKEPEVTIEEEASDPAGELVHEIRFYIAQSMWSEAEAGLYKLTAIAPGHPELAGLKQAHAAGAIIAAAQDTVEEVAEPVPALDAVVEESPVVEETPVAEEAAEPVVSAETYVEFAPPAPTFEVVPEEPLPELPEPVFEHELLAQEEPLAEAVPAEVVAEAEPKAEVAEVVPEPVVASSEPEPEDVLGDFVMSLESSLGDDFNPGGGKALPSAKPAAATEMPAAAAFKREIPVPSAPVVPAIAASAESSGATAAAVAAAPAPTAAFDDEATSALSDLFAEFKEEIEDEDKGGQQEDPETHYNLGMAFKEMGLLDEAIGELQKVCQAIDRGTEFSQTMQAYTWLAHCFVEKGVPEASFKWYERALKLADNEETRTAIHYELACAYEAANRRPEALNHFMEVYTTNIDFRDVAERIKALKS